MGVFSLKWVGPAARDGKWVFVRVWVECVGHYRPREILYSSTPYFEKRNKCKDCFSHYRLGRVGVKLCEKLLTERLNLQCHYIKVLITWNILYIFSAAGGILSLHDVSERTWALLMGRDAPPRVFKKSAANYIHTSSSNIASFYIVVFWACLIFIFSHTGARLCAARCDMQKERLMDMRSSDAAHSHHYSKRRRGASLGSLDLLSKRAAAFSHMHMSTIRDWFYLR